MQFPERPTCHQSDVQSIAFLGRERPKEWPVDMPDYRDANGFLWHTAGVRQHTYEQVDGEWRETGEKWEAEPFRTCGYCGSIHPEDLLRFLDAGAQLGGADWKYGWPHKFYVENIPNPQPERLYVISTTSQGSRVLDVKYGTRQTLHAKWYNNHITDDGFDDEARAKLLAALERHADIVFEIVDGKLHYRAPSAGYQRSNLPSLRDLHSEDGDVHPI